MENLDLLAKLGLLMMTVCEFKNTSSAQHTIATSTIYDQQAKTLLTDLERLPAGIDSNIYSRSQSSKSTLRPAPSRIPVYHGDSMRAWFSSGNFEVAHSMGTRAKHESQPTKLVLTFFAGLTRVHWILNETSSVCR